MAKLTQCPNGHFYDMERSSQCPYCSQSEAQPPMPPDCPGEEEFLARLAERESAAQARGVTGDIPPVDGADAGKTVPLREETAGRTVPLQEEVMNKTVPLQEEAMNKTQPLDGAGMDKTQPLSDAGMGRTVPLADAGTPARQSNWQNRLLRVSLDVTVFVGLLSVLGCVYFLWRWEGHTGELLATRWYREVLVSLACCVVTCLCCVGCLRTKGARPGFPLSIVLAAASIGLPLYGSEPWLRSISHFGLRRTFFLNKSGLIEAVIKMFCLGAAILAWAAIFLYQKKQKQDKIQ